MDPAAATSGHPIARSSPQRMWLFRGLAVLIGLSPFLVAEVGLRWLDWRPTANGDPFVDFKGITPLFEPDASGQFYAIPKSRQEFFHPEQFPIKKPAGSYRIFCLGGSTVQGRPFGIRTSFTQWLEIELQAADPSRPWDVINCGGVSYASYRLTPILRECLQHEPDLIVLYTGHNEFLESRSYPLQRSAPAWLIALHRGLLNSRLYQFAANGSASAAAPRRTILETEVDALLDYRGGLERYHRDPAERAAVVRHFRFNVQKMIGMCRSARVPVLLVDPPANVRDCPPFKVELDPRLSTTDRQQFQQHLRAAQGLLQKDPRRARSELETALTLDPQHAGALFLLGHLQLAAGERETAARTLQRAKDADVCSLRILSSMNAALREIATQTDTPLADVRAYFVGRASDGIPGDESFVDHVHPTIQRHQEIAALLRRKLEDLNIVQVQPGADARRRELQAALWNTIDEVYMQRGKQRLEGLRRWAEGRAFKVRKADAAP